MATFTVRPEGIIRTPALSMPGNATGSEAACTALTASQIRTLLSLATTSDVTFDIVRATTSVQTPLVNNASAALTLGNSTYGVTVPGAAVVSGDISMSKTSAQGYVYSYAPTGGYYVRLYQDDSGPNAYVENSYGSIWLRSGTGRVGVLKSGTQVEFRTWDPSVAAYTTMLHNGTNGILSTSSGNLNLTAGNAVVNIIKSGSDAALNVYNSAASGYINISPSTVTASGGDGNLYLTSSYVTLAPTTGRTNGYRIGVNSEIYLYDTTGTKYTTWTHNSTNGVITTSSGNLNLVPTGGTVAVTGGITASGVVSHGAYTVATLPSAASNAGKMAQVTDSSVAASGNYGATVAAGGANRVKVFSDGTNWVIA